MDREIKGTAKTHVGYEELTSIKGVGPRAAAVFLPSIGNVDDFETADKLAAYFGIVPKVSQSNETDHRGRTTKRGNKLARTTLVQCTLIAIRYSGYLNRAYRRIKKRRGPAKPSSQPHANFSKSSSTPSKTTGSSKTSQTSKSPVVTTFPLDNHHRKVFGCLERNIRLKKSCAFSRRCSSQG